MAVVPCGLALVNFTHLSLKPATASITGNCKNVELTFKNNTNGTITIPQTGHRVKNPGSLEGWNQLSLDNPIANLAANGQQSDTLKLNIKCVTDAEFEILWSDNNGDHVSHFQSKDISDKEASFSLR
ncbi:MAG: hypothetical protein HC792_03715 [Acaryochloridaceae cyanobacterium CSU_5_19]|nr:hypothetical protein [Acaryochloridaceae cyanobacterium CSU_5_19]